MFSGYFSMILFVSEVYMLVHDISPFVLHQFLNIFDRRLRQVTEILEMQELSQKLLRKVRKADTKQDRLRFRLFACEHRRHAIEASPSLPDVSQHDLKQSNTNRNKPNHTLFSE